MVTIWYLEKDRRKETNENQGIEHKVTQDPAAGPKRLQAEGTEVKRSARNAKRAFAEELAGEAKHAAARGETSAVYKTTKRLCGKNISQSAPVKDKDNNNLTTALEQAARWVQHFGEVLNRPEPDDPADHPPTEDVLNINISLPTEAEVRRAIQNTKILVRQLRFLRTS